MSGRLAAAAALRTRPGDVGPIWGALSAQLSELAFRYADGVGVRCFPKASAPAPGCCYLASGTILLDGELIRDPGELAAEKPSMALRGDLAVLTGVLLHECGHANHSLMAVKAACFDAGYAKEHAMLEEPRMEAQLCRRFAVAVRFIQAAVRAINAPNLPGPGEPLSRWGAAHVGVVVGGRESAGSVPAGIRDRAWGLVEAGLGSADGAKLRELVARTCDVADDDIEATIAACEELRELIGPTENAPSLPEGVVEPLRELIEEALEGAAKGAAGELADQGDGEGDDGLEGARETLEELVERAGEEVRRCERTKRGTPAHVLGSGGGFHSHPGGAPGKEEKRAARSMEVALRRVRARRTAREGSGVPGRFTARRAMGADADRARGIMRVPEPYTRRIEVNGRLWAPEVGVAIDTSGSMSSQEGVLASVIWVAAKAVRGIGGRFCAVGFGDEGELICGPGEGLATVPQFSCRGGTERFDLAAAILEGQLRLHDRRRPRLLVIVSDGVWMSHADLSEAELRRIRESGVATVHVGIGGPPREHGAERSGSIPSAEALGEVLGEECRRALERRV